MPRYSDLFAKQPAPARGGRLSALSREELQAYVDDVAPTFAQRFGNEVRANAPPNYETGTLIERGQRDLARMGQPMTLDQAAVATAGVPGLGDVVGLAADARAVYDDPSWANIGGAALGALPFVPAMGAIRAFHGSPHDFDRFDMSKIGTGEGAQAYGHGLYFAGNEDVAETYKTSVTRNMDQLRDIARAHGLDGDAAEMLAQQFSSGFGGKRYNEWLDGLSTAIDDPLVSDRVKTAARQILDKSVEASDAFAVMKSPGHMYEVNINADPDDFLDWDRPLSEQPQKVREFLATRDPDMYTPGADDYDAAEPGSISYERLAKTRTPRETGKLRLGDSGATSALREAGIPGIRYLDQGSRAAGEGTRNYVVFDDKLIDIIRKYGIGALLGGTGAFGLMSMQDEDGTQPPL